MKKRILKRGGKVNPSTPDLKVGVCSGLTLNGAKTLHELGLEHPDFFQRITRPRDYKQFALQILMKRGIISQNEDGRTYMVKERLDQDLRKKGDDLFSH